MTPFILFKMLGFLFKKKENEKIEVTTIKDIYIKIAEIEGRLSLLETRVKKINDYIRGEKLNEWKEESVEKKQELETELMTAIAEYQSGMKLQDVITKHPSLLKIASKFL